MPPREDASRYHQAKLVWLVCAAIIAAVWGVILFWKATGDLEAETPIAGLFLTLLLAGIGLLTKKWSGAALVILAAILAILLAFDLTYYGLQSTTSAAFLIPMLMILSGFGRRAGWIAAGASAAMIWFLAAGEWLSWWPTGGHKDISILTFDAPALTVIFFLCMLVATTIPDRGGR